MWSNCLKFDDKKWNRVIHWLMVTTMENKIWRRKLLRIHFLIQICKWYVSDHSVPIMGGLKWRSLYYCYFITSRHLFPLRYITALHVCIRHCTSASNLSHCSIIYYTAITDGFHHQQDGLSIIKKQEGQRSRRMWPVQLCVRSLSSCVTIGLVCNETD